MEGGHGRRTRVAAVALLAPLLAAARPAAADPTCTPVVRVSGEAPLVDQVSALLRARHLPLTGASPCGLVVATLTGAGPRVRLIIVDPDGRRIERTADDVESAATAIESWARRDVGEPLLASRSLAGGAPAAPGAATVVKAEDRDEGLGLGVAVAAVGGISQDGGMWAGVQARGCGEVGPLCIGGVARYARDTATRGDAALFDSSRYAVSLLGSADLPLSRGRVWWSPGVAIGQSSFHARRLSDTEDASALLVRAHLAASVRVRAAWSAGVDLAGEYSPGSNVRLGDESGDEPGDTLAGAPRWGAWIGLSVSYGGP